VPRKVRFQSETRTKADVHYGCPLIPRAPQRSLQSIFLLSPASVFGLGPFLESICLCLDRCGGFSVLAFTGVKRRLRRVDGLMPPFTLFLPGGRFPCTFAVALLLLPS
jgi:hypothetical protein